MTHDRNRRELVRYWMNKAEETTAQKLAGLHDLEVLEELAKAVYAADDPVKAGLVILPPFFTDIPQLDGHFLPAGCF